MTQTPANPATPPEELKGPAIATLVDEMLRRMPVAPFGAVAGLSRRRLKTLQADIRVLVARLNDLLIAVDPVSHPSELFDPADPRTVGQLIAQTMLRQEPVPLAVLRDKKFHGSGVYAVYYRGAFPAYAPISKTNTPIYVGKADPQAKDARTAVEQGTTLWRRLADHSKSIRAARNLDLEDFDVRYLVVRTAWESTAETYLIRSFTPVWNSGAGPVFGFGKHGDSPKTRANKRSPWDTLHSGRAWATSQENVPGRLSVADILTAVGTHFTSHPPIE